MTKDEEKYRKTCSQFNFAIKLPQALFSVFFENIHFELKIYFCCGSVREILCCLLILNRNEKVLQM